MAEGDCCLAMADSLLLRSVARQHLRDVAPPLGPQWQFLPFRLAIFDKTI